MLVVVIGWVMFAVNGIGEFGVYITRMFGGYGGTDYLDHIVSVILVLVLGAFFATPVFIRLFEKIKNNIIGVVLLVGLFWASVSALVDAAYNPFLYFRF